MFCIQPATLRLALLFPMLAVHNAVAAEDASTQILKDGNDSDYLSIVQPADVTDKPTEDEIHRLLGLYMDARLAAMLEEADALAKQIVVLSIEAYGRESIGTANALTNLAELQAANDDTIAAIQNLLAAVGILERVDSRLSMELIVPLNAMGAIHHRVGDAEGARAAWNRAVHITHVNLGPHNYEQIDSLSSIEELLTEAGKRKDAMKMQKRIVLLQMRDAELRRNAIASAGVVQSDSVKP